MRHIFLILLAFFSFSAFCQGAGLQEKLNAFGQKHKKAYLYCHKLTDGDQQTCFPLQEIKLVFDSSLDSNNYISAAHYHESVLTLKFNPRITKSGMEEELNKYSQRLLDPL